MPYLIWAFVYAPFTFENVPRFLYGSWERLGEAGTLTSLWYLTVFFVARLLTQGVFSLLDRAGIRNAAGPYGLCAAPLLLVGFLLPKLPNGYPCPAAGFILLCAAFCRHFLILAQQKGQVLCAVIERYVPQLLGQFPRYQ